VEHDSCQGTIKTDRIQQRLLKITNGNSGKALQALALSSATRPEEARFHGHQKEEHQGLKPSLAASSAVYIQWDGRGHQGILSHGMDSKSKTNKYSTD